MLNFNNSDITIVYFWGDWFPGNASEELLRHFNQFSYDMSKDINISKRTVHFVFVHLEHKDIPPKYSGILSETKTKNLTVINVPEGVDLNDNVSEAPTLGVWLKGDKFPKYLKCNGEIKSPKNNSTPSKSPFSKIKSHYVIAHEALTAECKKEVLKLLKKNEKLPGSHLTDLI